MVALAPRTRGRRSGEECALSVEQEQAIQRTICDKRPEQLKMDFFLWSRAAVMQLIEREYGIKLHVRSVGKYLARWGFTPQKPIKRAYEQSPAAVKEWLDTQYPQIAQRAKAEGAEIHWVDILPVLKNGDSHRWRAMSGPGGMRRLIRLRFTASRLR